MNTLTQQLNKADSKLVADGWTFVMSVMNDGGNEKYGKLYFKGDAELYVNEDTLSAILLAN